MTVELWLLLEASGPEFLMAAFDRYLPRPVTHDGKPLALGIAVTTSVWKIQVPENHLLRLIDRYINLDFIEGRLVLRTFPYVLENG